MSDTPRTDAMKEEIFWNDRFYDVVRVKFSQQLEKELNDLKQSIFDLPHCPNCNLLLKEREQLLAEEKQQRNERMEEIINLNIKVQELTAEVERLKAVDGECLLLTACNRQQKEERDQLRAEVDRLKGEKK